MAREWSADCVDCGKTFSYSDATFEAARIKGESLPEVCPTCEKEFARERRTIGRGWSGLTGQSLPGAWSGRAIGHIDLLREPGSTSQVFPQRYEEDRSKFGVSDERLIRFPGNHCLMVDGLCLIEDQFRSAIASTMRHQPSGSDFLGTI